MQLIPKHRRVVFSAYRCRGVKYMDGKARRAKKFFCDLASKFPDFRALRGTQPAHTLPTLCFWYASDLAGLAFGPLKVTGDFPSR